MSDIVLTYYMSAKAEIERLRACVASQEECIEKLEAKAAAWRDDARTTSEFAGEQIAREMRLMAERDTALSRAEAAEDALTKANEENERWRTCFSFPNADLAPAVQRARFWLGLGESSDGLPYGIEPDFDRDPQDAASEFARAVVELFGRLRESQASAASANSAYRVCVSDRSKLVAERDALKLSNDRLSLRPTTSTELACEQLRDEANRLRQMLADVATDIENDMVHLPSIHPGRYASLLRKKAGVVK